MPNRSKAEIHFAELCINYFGEQDVICNGLIFSDRDGGLWDSDIFIKSLNKAILYDGLWHFKKLREGHNIAQVQSRDTIRRKVIRENQATYHTVRDLGKYNADFVVSEFNKFIHSLTFSDTLLQLQK
jgi:hypothetical protein